MHHIPFCVGVVLVFASGTAFAGSPQSCRDVLSGSGASISQKTYCDKRAADARGDLKQRGIDAAGLSDIDAIERADREYDTARAQQGLLGSDVQTAAEKRQDLAGWGVNASGLSDADVRSRWKREKAAHLFADLQSERRTSEAKTLGSLFDKDAEAAKKNEYDGIARQATQSAEGMRRAAEMARTQGDAAVRHFGIDPDALNSDDEDEANAAGNAFDQSMYQQMIDSGLAPGCKGKTGEAMAKCVEAALDADGQ